MDDEDKANVDHLSMLMIHLHQANNVHFSVCGYEDWKKLCENTAALKKSLLDEESLWLYTSRSLKDPEVW